MDIDCHPFEPLFDGGIQSGAIHYDDDVRRHPPLAKRRRHGAQYERLPTAGGDDDTYTCTVHLASPPWIMELHHSPHPRHRSNPVVEACRQRLLSR